MKVLVLSPPTSATQNVVRDLIYGCWCKGKRIAGAKSPPTNLLYVATMLKQQGHDVRLLDATAEYKTAEYVKEIIPQYDAVVESTSTMSFTEDADFLKELKAINPRLTTMMFGSHVTFNPVDSLNYAKELDIVVRKEPDLVVRDVVNALERGESWKEVKGISYREDGRLKQNPDAPWIEELDRLPIPDRSLLPAGVDYFNPIVKRIPYTTAMSSRACPAECSFCTVPFFYGVRVTCRSANNVFEEMRYLQERGFREVWFRDETFTVYGKRNRELYAMLGKEKVDITWICNARVNTVTREMLQQMKRAGCHLIKFGVESGVQSILDNVSKGATLQQARDAFKLCREVGIDTHAHMMLGMPGDTRETVEQSIRFVKSLRPSTVTFGICTPYAGTEMFFQVAKEHPEIRDGTGLNLKNLHEKAFFNQYFTDLGAEELEAYLHRAYRDFYFRPGYVLERFSRVNSVEELRRLVMAGTQVFGFGMDWE
ncbi:radical SAM protein [Candidatus Woesearchaeota archaeon]|nr:radical SAM protein [Candidatus Woesearchaeota archaeon]